MEEKLIKMEDCEDKGERGQLIQDLEEIKFEVFRQVTKRVYIPLAVL